MEDELSNFKYLEAVDYADHMGHWEQLILEHPQSKVRKLSRNSREYMESLVLKIKRNNELFFTSREKIRFYVLMDSRPFYFSLPEGAIFFSSTLLKEHIKHEEFLVTVLTSELIRTEKNIYNRSAIHPVGYLDITKALSLLRISLRDKHELNKWTFQVLKRSGFDGYALVYWTQVLNKNSVEFLDQLGSSTIISREETLLRSFISSTGLSKVFKERQVNSSPDFYRFKVEIDRITL